MKFKIFLNTSKRWMSPISHDRAWMNQALSWHVSVLPLSYGNKTDFSPTFPPMGSTVGAFYWLFLWNFKSSVMVYGCFISTVRWTIRPFFQFSPWRDPRLRHFAGYPFGTSRKKASTIFYNTAISKNINQFLRHGHKWKRAAFKVDTLKKHSAKKGFAFLQ